jgi:hypothetical protein
VDLHGVRVVVVGVASELTVGVLSPGPDRAVVPQRQAEVLARRHLDDAGEVTHVIGPVDLHGDIVRIVRVDTELAMGVVPPSVDGTVALESQAV